MLLIIEIKYSLSESGVPPNSVLFGRTVPPISVLFGGSVPPNSVLFDETVPLNSFPQTPHPPDRMSIQHFNKKFNLYCYLVGWLS